ncbi:unnamed protein product, partial [Brassica oleracea var. botrytis]
RVLNSKFLTHDLTFFLFLVFFFLHFSVKNRFLEHVQRRELRHRIIGTQS